VRRNRGAAGVDGQSLVVVEQYGVERFLEELGATLQAGKYRPNVVLRRYTSKADGKKRPLGIPTIRDRVAQMAAKLVLPSGYLWEKKRERLYFLNRWPSQRSMQRIRQRVKEVTPKWRCHTDLRDVIADLNPVLEGGATTSALAMLPSVSTKSTRTSGIGCSLCA
jgi:hypothetical protein